MTLPRSLVLQGVQFDGAYALSLHEGLDCLREITTPRGPVNQSLNAIADFYEQPDTQSNTADWTQGLGRSRAPLSSNFLSGGAWLLSQVETQLVATSYLEVKLETK